MRRIFVFATSAAVLLGTASLAVAQPAYGPNAAYYPGYAEPAPPPSAVYAPPSAVYAQPNWDGTHSGGGAARAYSYGGAQKSN
ncbi:MAG: hypothetical protein WB697_08660 [Stellaceae bacterium]